MDVIPITVHECINGEMTEIGAAFNPETEKIEMPEHSDGSTASYYELPEGATELQDLISARDMNAQIGEIFRAAYRYGKVSHSDRLRDAKKIRFYAEAEVRRLQNQGFGERFSYKPAAPMPERGEE